MLKRHRRHCRPPEVEAAPFVGSGQNTGSCVVWLTLQQQQAKHKVAQKSSLRSREVFLSQKQTALNFHFSDKSISHIVCVWWCKADKCWDGAKVHQHQHQKSSQYSLCTWSVQLQLVLQIADSRLEMFKLVAELRWQKLTPCFSVSWKWNCQKVPKCELVPMVIYPVWSKTVNFSVAREMWGWHLQWCQNYQKSTNPNLLSYFTENLSKSS